MKPDDAMRRIHHERKVTTNMVINTTAGALIALAILGHASIGRLAAPPRVINAFAWVITALALLVIVLAVTGH